MDRGPTAAALLVRSSTSRLELKRLGFGWASIVRK